MPEVLTQAASSPVETVDPFNGGTPTLGEFERYRRSGELPERFEAVVAEPAPAEEVEVQAEEPPAAPESAPENDQEPPEGIGNKARKRFEKLLAEKKDLERRLAEAAKTDVKPAPSTAPQPPQIAPSRPEPTIEDKNEDGTLKYADYADFVKALGRWSAEQTLHEAKQREVQQQKAQRAQEGIEDARARYGEEFDKVLLPTAGFLATSAAIPLNVKEALEDSDVLPELLYTLGTDEKTMKDFERLSRTNPIRAIKYIGDIERGIRQELEADSTPEPIERPPEPRRTSAPKPPSPVTGPTSRSFDVSDDSLSADEWMRKRNAQVGGR